MSAISALAGGCRRLSAAALGLLVLTAGCSSGGLYSVRGQLVYADNEAPVKELAGYEVTFNSEEHGSARGKIREDGTFELTTVRENDGVAPGNYVVTLSQPH